MRKKGKCWFSGKIAHSKRGDADKESSRMAKKNKEPLTLIRSYICIYCHKWHIGHVPQQKG